MTIRSIALSLAFAAAAPAAMAVEAPRAGGLDGLIATHAKANGVPEDLVHRIVRRESGYNPRAVGRGGALGLMQIKHATARGVGYSGPASGLLDANTNLTYGVRYLAGAYRTAGGNADRTVAYYASGYYYAAKRQGLTTRVAAAEPAPQAQTVVAKDVQSTASVSSLFSFASADPALAADSQR